jgi:hypothetical protein
MFWVGEDHQYTFAQAYMKMALAQHFFAQLLMTLAKAIVH